VKNASENRWKIALSGSLGQRGNPVIGADCGLFSSGRTLEFWASLRTTLSAAILHQSHHGGCIVGLDVLALSTGLQVTRVHLSS